MKKFLPLLIMVCGALNMHAITVTDSIFNRYDHEEFAFGADVSFVPAMEGWGTKWLDKYGKQKDILQILKEQGINSIRLRVWTVASGASSKAEVISMCRRAKAKGMNVMIDFHYSDTWADPGHQEIPSAWTDHNVDTLAKRLYEHTYDVLSAIKKIGVVPKWVQVGNETKRGMLYPVGQTNQGGAAAFAKFVLSGYNAVKAVDSTMQVIVHLPDGHDNSLYRSIFDGLKKNGAKWDIIGLSAYPRWSHLDGPTMITRVMANINDLKKRYGTPCMIVETGHYPSEAIVGNQYLVGVMDRMIKNDDLGCFYWEPESMGGYDMGAWDESTRKPTEMMDAFLGIKHTEVSWLMYAKMLSPTKEQTFSTGDIEMKTRVLHQRAGRIRSVEFHMDNKNLGTVKVENPETVGRLDTLACNISNVETGVHTAWAKAVDNGNNTETTDTMTFFVGESSLFDKGLTDDNVIVRWGIDFSESGKYRMVFKYSCASFVGTQITLDDTDVSSPFFTKITDGYKAIDMEAAEAGKHTLQMKALYSSKLPDIASLRIFPLDGQTVPKQTDITGITSTHFVSDEAVSVYSLSGVLLYNTTLSALGITLGDKTSAVVVLPDSSDGMPRIVRKK